MPDPADLPSVAVSIRPEDSYNASRATSMATASSTPTRPVCSLGMGMRFVSVWRAGVTWKSASKMMSAIEDVTS